MYGMVNAAVAQLAREVGGEQAWQDIRTLAEVPHVSFVGMRAYPDETTYALVGAASQVLGMPPEQVLRAFGQYWVRYTAQQGWGPLLRAAGDTLPEVLAGLDGLHARVRMTMPELRPPSFTCTELAPDTLRLEYFSHRAGLAPMVVGLVEGLAEMLGAVATVTHTSPAEEGGPETFLVVHRTAPP